MLKKSNRKFKNTTKKIAGGGSFKSVINSAAVFETFDFNFTQELEIDFEFSIVRDFDKLKMPKENNGIFFFTDRVRTPDGLIANIEKRFGIKDLIIFGSEVLKSKYIDKATYVISNSKYKENNRYNIHAKVFTVNNFCIFASGNFKRTNASVEQYLITNSKCLKEKIKYLLQKKY